MLNLFQLVSNVPSCKQQLNSLCLD